MQCFSKNTLIRLPYILDGFGMLKIDFNNKSSFELLTCQEIKLAAFTSVRVKFSFACHLEQMLVFEINPNIGDLDADMTTQMPPFYEIHETILHNFRNTEIIIRENSTIGFLNIKTFTDDTTFIPKKVNDVQFQTMKMHFENRTIAC